MKITDISQKLTQKVQERKELTRLYRIAKPIYNAIKDRNFEYSIMFDSVMRDRNPMYIRNLGSRLKSYNYEIHINPYLVNAGDKVLRGFFSHEFSHTRVTMSLLSGN